MNALIKTLFVVVTFASASNGFAQTDHSQHQQHTKPTYTAPKVKAQPETLSKIPASGKSREAGYDNRYIMETTSSKDTLLQNCAKGTRGIVMLDNKTWARCGGKPEGAAQGPDKQAGKGHTDHSMH